MFNNRCFCRPTFLIALGTLLTLAACDHRTPPDPAMVPDQTIYLLNDVNQLVRTSVRTPNSPAATVNLTGLQQGEQVLAIDFRPATGQLYGVSNQSRLYVINQLTGIARAVNGPFSPGVLGGAVGFDFNPTADRIRLVTNTGQNLRLDPETGAVQNTDGSINGAPNATITGVAYTNNKAGATTTVLYDIDPVTDRLYIQNQPNDGRLVDVGGLGLPITAVGGFDIAPDGRGLAAVTFEGRSELDQVDLGTGKLQKLGDLPGNIIGLAIPTAAVAYAVDATNSLHIFNPVGINDETIKPLTGLQAGESLIGIDFRPANGQLYALAKFPATDGGDFLHLYTVNTANGALTFVGTLNTSTLGPVRFFGSGNGVGSLGFDFNPVVDRIRIVTSSGFNLRVNPSTAEYITDIGFNGPSDNVTASAYTNNFAGATATQLFNIGSTGGRLFLQDPPNNGTQILIGSLNLPPFEADNGFDIGGMSGTAYALLRINNSVNVYKINLTTGAATSVTSLPSSPIIRGFALGLGL